MILDLRISFPKLLPRPLVQVEAINAAAICYGLDEKRFKSVKDYIYYYTFICRTKMFEE